MTQSTSTLLEKGLTALDDGDLPGAKEALGQAKQELGEQDAGVLHLSGAIAWASGEIERASGFFMQAVDLGPADPMIYLDCAELLLQEVGDIDEAEGALRLLLAREDLDPDARDEANFAMARCLSHHDDENMKRALDFLDKISEENRFDPGCVALRSEILLDLGQHGDAIAALEEAIKEDPEEADLHYLHSIALRESGNEDKARSVSMRVYELDSQAMGDRNEVDYAEQQELRSSLEEIFEDLPDPLLRRVAQAPITVKDRLDSEQVQGGADPRAVLLFEGTPGVLESDEQEAEEPQLERIVLIRDMLNYGVDAEDEGEIAESLLNALVTEIQLFFGMDELVVASV